MVLRLKVAMQSLISQNQSAFVGGRQIQDNLVIVHEMLHMLKKRRRGQEEEVLIKLDMHKAYDRLDWAFLERVLTAYGFLLVWVQRVMTLTKGVSYKIKINGFTGKAFSPQRGLRQGDPLSPYLFILASDVISHLFKHAVIVGSVRGIQLPNAGPCLTHLLFDDDSILFARANTGNVQHPGLPESVFTSFGPTN